LQLLQRRIVGNLGVRGGRVVAAVRVGEKELPVVFGREVIVVAAVVRVGVGGSLRCDASREMPVFFYHLSLSSCAIALIMTNV